MFLNEIEGISFLLFFGVLIFLLIFFYHRKQNNTAGMFLVSNRRVGFFLGAVSTATAWIWAPALFVASQKAYQQGLPGIFWFTLPNALALVLFAFLAHRMRKIFDDGFTLPQYIRSKYGKRLHFVYLVTIFIVQIYAVVVQVTGALLLLTMISGLSKNLLIVFLGAIILTLSLLKGMRSSLVTDVVKASFITSVCLIVVPWVINLSGGIPSVIEGFSGISGKFGNIFDPMVAWTFGIPITVSLLSGVVIDQQQWQRAFSIKKGSVKGAFILGGSMFMIVPIVLGLLGFIAANRSLEILVAQPQLAGFAAVFSFLPTSGVILFVLMVLAGLMASGSAALSAVGSMGSVDVLPLFLKKIKFEDKKIIFASRITMILVMIVALLIALIPNIQILYMQLLVGAFRAGLFLPTILCLFWSRLNPVPTFWGVILGMIVGVPLFIYGYIINNQYISSFGSLAPIFITLVFCSLSFLGKEKVKNYEIGQ